MELFLIVSPILVFMLITLSIALAPDKPTLPAKREEAPSPLPEKRVPQPKEEQYTTFGDVACFVFWHFFGSLVVLVLAVGYFVVDLARTLYRSLPDSPVHIHLYLGAAVTQDSPEKTSDPSNNRKDPPR